MTLSPGGEAAADGQAALRPTHWATEALSWANWLRKSDKLSNLVRAGEALYLLAFRAHLMV